MKLLGRLVALLTLLRAWRRRHDAPPPGEHDADPRERRVPEDRRAETVTAALLWASAGFGFAFLVLYVVWDDTRILGLAGGLCLLCVAAALMLAAARVVPQETAVEDRGELDQGPEEHRALAEQVRAGGEGISRRKLLAAAGTASAAGLGVILVTPAASLGPRVRRTLTGSPWHDGRRLVDEHDRPIRADDLEVGSFTTAFPEGADKRDLGSPVILARVRPEEIHASRPRAAWSPDGLLAYSKICTHAGCAISEFRYPLFPQDTATSPALVCPCHYSTFDPLRGAEVTFGPAGRPLPQLPLRLEADGTLSAAGDLSDAPGPAWWGTKGPST